jgi:hypothetical protein
MVFIPIVEFLFITGILSHPRAEASTNLFKSLNIYPKALQYAAWD